MSDKRAYTYSYSRLRGELIAKKSFEPRKFSKQTELEWLCRAYLHDEEISNYNSIEWQALGIGINLLPKIIKWIDNFLESARIIVYLRDHAQNILANTSDSSSEEMVKSFVRKCNNYLLLWKLHDLFFAKIKRLTLSNGENRPFIIRIEDPSTVPVSLTDTTAYTTMRAIRGHVDLGRLIMCDATIVPLLPTIDEARGNGCFTTHVVLNTSLFVRFYIRQLYYSTKDEAEWLHITNRLCLTDELLKQIRNSLTYLTNRSLNGRTQPEIQALFVICVYLTLETEEDSPYSPYYKSCVTAMRQQLTKANVTEQQIYTGIETLRKAINKTTMKEFAKKAAKMELDSTNNHSNSQHTIEKEHPVVFISYSWDGETHEDWVLKLATDLRANYGIDVILDKWELKLGKLLPHFMAHAVTDSDRVICVMTPNYKKKSDGLKGGVGMEYSIISTEILQNINTEKFIPLFRSGEDAPIFLAGRDYIDMRDDTKYLEKIEDLARDILEIPKYKKPQLGAIPKFN